MYQRNTIQRTVILQAVKKLKNHPTADEVYAEVTKEYPTISRTTVYRNLLQLSEAGEIRHCELFGGADHYDYLCTDHYHVRCVKCGKVVDADMAYLPDLEKNIRDDHGFAIFKHDIIFQGVCPACQKKADAEKSDKKEENG